MAKKLKIPQFKTPDEEMEFYANIDLYGEARELSPAEEKALDRTLGVRRRKTTLTAKGQTKAAKKVSRKAS